MEQKFTEDENLKYAEENGFHRVDSRLPLLTLLPKKAVGAEIGVFAGLFSKALLSELEPVEFHMIDVWERMFSPNYPDWGAYTAYGNLKTAVAREAARERAMVFSEKTKVHLHETSSEKWLKSIPDEYLDWVYLDSSHSYEGTMTELDLLRRKMKPSGIITGDDFWRDPDSPHYGVFRAVHTFCLNSPFKLLYADHSGQWAIQIREI